MIEVPEVVANKARDLGADAWLDDLGGLVASLLAQWDLTLGSPLADGTEAYVTKVERHDGSPAVLKLMIPRPSDDGLGSCAAASEATVLRLAGGHGCAELFASDVERGALLMERLGPSLFELGAPLATQHQIMIRCASALWQPAPESGLTSGAEKARWMIENVSVEWERHDRPCSERAVEHAIACGERRRAAHDPERSSLVHGDVHQWNTLQTLDGSSHKLVDPDGLLAEPEYDLGIIMREDPVALMNGNAFDRAAWLAGQTGLDARAIWEWGVIERVSTGLMCASIGLQPIGSQMLAAADLIAEQNSS